jgi:hypothetical protein
VISPSRTRTHAHTHAHVRTRTWRNQPKTERRGPGPRTVVTSWRRGTWYATSVLNSAAYRSDAAWDPLSLSQTHSLSHTLTHSLTHSDTLSLSVSLCISLSLSWRRGTWSATSVLDTATGADAACSLSTSSPPSLRLSVPPSLRPSRSLSFPYISLPARLPRSLPRSLPPSLPRSLAPSFLVFTQRSHVDCAPLSLLSPPPLLSPLSLSPQTSLS